MEETSLLLEVKTGPTAIPYVSTACFSPRGEVVGTYSLEEKEVIADGRRER